MSRHEPAEPQGQKKREFAWPLRVYWEDTDAGGIVFYANYLRYFERARTEWLRDLGFDQSALRRAHGGMFVVTDATLRYLAPARLDDELLVTACLRESGRASLTIRQQARRQGIGGELVLCEGTVRIGWVDSNSLRPARMPALLLEAFT